MHTYHVDVAVINVLQLGFGFHVPAEGEGERDRGVCACLELDTVEMLTSVTSHIPQVCVCVCVCGVCVRAHVCVCTCNALRTNTHPKLSGRTRSISWKMGLKTVRSSTRPASPPTIMSVRVCAGVCVCLLVFVCVCVCVSQYGSTQLKTVCTLSSYI